MDTTQSTPTSWVSQVRFHSITDTTTSTNGANNGAGNNTWTIQFQRNGQIANVETVDSSDQPYYYCQKSASTTVTATVQDGVRSLDLFLPLPYQTLVVDVDLQMASTRDSPALSGLAFANTGSAVNPDKVKNLMVWRRSSSHTI